MRYSELTEGDRHKFEIAFINKIKQDCKPYLDEIKNPPAFVLYRGLHDTEGYGKKTARLTSRTPQDSSAKTHSHINQYFEKKFGHPYRNGVFASGSKVIASEYGQGEPYVIFPIGDFEYLWSQHIPDLYVEVAGAGAKAMMHWKKYAEAKGEKIPLSASRQEYWKSVNEYRMNHHVWELIEFLGGYQDTELRKGIFSTHEVMLWCNEYYYMPKHFLALWDKT